MLNKLAPILKPLVVRGSDKFGSGAFGASRGIREHLGLDLKCAPGQRVFAPFDAIAKRKGIAYEGDSLQLLELVGIGEWGDFRAKLLYCLPFPELIHKQVLAGEVIALAQSLQERYPGITDHIHLYLYDKGELIDPTPLVLGEVGIVPPAPTTT